MDTKVMGIAAIAVVALLVGAVFVFGLGGTNSSNSGTDTDNATSVTDEDDSDTDDSSSWSAASTDSTSVSGFEISYVSGTADCYTISTDGSETVVTFNEISEETVYLISGTLSGYIVVNAGDDYDFKLGLSGVTITSAKAAPIAVNSSANFHLAAKNGTTNTIKDTRSTITDDSVISSAVWADCDLKLKGNGTLNVTSSYNNGIHCKADLTVRNLTLTVSCVDNALKGNDSVSIKSGDITLEATSGDGIKTVSTDKSSSGTQRGTVTINSNKGETSVDIDAYYDGIVAAYNVIIEETTDSSVTVDIYTYTGASTSTTTTQSSTWGGSPRNSGDGIDSGSGNSATTDSSAKGIKAENSININSGTVTINSTDDAIHANSGTKMDSGETGCGYVYITGGTISLSSSDDAIHADGTVSISGGTLTIPVAYEGVEGTTINVSGGKVSVISSDDGFNSSGVTTLSGGYIYVYAGGDGLDSNYSSTGIVFSGATVGVIATGEGENAIDSDGGYSYKSGKVLAICNNSGNMSGENYACSNFSSVGTKSTVSASSGAYLTAGSLAIKMPTSVSGIAVYLSGSSSGSISTSSSTSLSQLVGNLYG